jgi:hypothetical protein
MCGRVTVKATWAELIALSDDGGAAAQSAIAIQRLPGKILQRVKPRSFAFDKGHALPKCVRHDQNIGK